MTPEEFSLIAAKPEGWQYLLMARALQREIGQGAMLRRQWHTGLVNQPAAAMEQGAWLEHVERTTSEARRTCGKLRALWGEALANTLAPPCDANAILAAARAVGDAYRTLLEWKPGFLAASAPAPLGSLRDEASRMCDPLVLRLETIAHGHSDRVLAALLETRRGDSSMQLPEPDEAAALALLARRGLRPQ